MIPAPKNVSESFVRNNYGAIDLDKYDWFADCEPELPAPGCNGIYRASGDPAVSVCDRCGDVSNSQADLPCGRVDDDPDELARMAADWAANAPASAGRNPFDPHAPRILECESDWKVSPYGDAAPDRDCYWVATYEEAVEELAAIRAERNA